MTFHLIQYAGLLITLSPTINNLPTQEDFLKLYAINGRFATQLMFWELSEPAKRKKHPPVFTLKMKEHQGLPSAYQVYMDSVDEYDAASKLAPNMRIWDDLCNNNWFMEGDVRHAHQGLAVWRDHMRARDASKAKGLLQAKAEGGDTTAMKALLQETKTKAPVGRKNKKVTKPKTDPKILAFRQKMNK